MTRTERRLAACHSVEALREAARRRLPRFVRDFVEGGCEGEACLVRNRAAFDAAPLVPRYLVDVTGRSTACELFGQRWAMPCGIAPTGLSSLVWPGGDHARAAAARDAGVPFLFPMLSAERLEEVAPQAAGDLWFQLYLLRDWAIMEDLAARARRVGIDVLVVTVDVPVSSKRERDRRNGFGLPLKLTARTLLDLAAHPAWSLATLKAGMPSLVNLAGYTSETGALGRAAFMAEQARVTADWSTVERLRALWPGRLVLKGLMAADDVARAAERGVDGVILSNHGGRQLDAAPSPFEVLSEAVEAAAGRTAILLDSGILRGGDVLRCLARGAAFTFVGRASLYGLAAGGEAGVARALAHIREEIDLGLGQMGCTSPAMLGAAHLLDARPRPVAAA